NDQVSWKVFFDTYWKLIYSSARKAGLTDDEAQEVVQETVISVCKSMPGFEYNAAGSFKNWLMKLTSWRIADQLRKREQRDRYRKRRARAANHTATVERLPDPAGVALEAVWDEEWERNLLAAAIERVKKKVDPRLYQIFDLYVFKDWPVSRVAQAVKTNRAWISLAKHRITRLIKTEITYLRTKLI